MLACERGCHGNLNTCRLRKRSAAHDDFLRGGVGEEPEARRCVVGGGGGRGEVGGTEDAHGVANGGRWRRAGQGFKMIGRLNERCDVEGVAGAVGKEAEVEDVQLDHFAKKMRCRVRCRA